MEGVNGGGGGARLACAGWVRATEGRDGLNVPAGGGTPAGRGGKGRRVRSGERAGRFRRLFVGGRAPCACGR